MNTPGKKYLKIIGILMIVFGGLGAIIYGMGVMGGGILTATATAEGAKGAAVGGGIIAILFVFGLIWSIIELIAGITGVKNCENPEKADTCFKMGMAVIVCALISMVWGIWVQGFSMKTIVSPLFGFILPALFCYGAKLNKSK